MHIRGGLGSGWEEKVGDRDGWVLGVGGFQKSGEGCLWARQGGQNGAKVEGGVKKIRRKCKLD